VKTVPSSTTSVRRGGPEDANQLRAIRLESLRDTPQAFGATFADANSWPWTRWQQVADQWHYFLAERDGVVVGMISGACHEELPGVCSMYGMYVTPEVRGTGLAARLVEAVAQWARDQGTSQLLLHVTTEVARARAFYEKIGFRATGETITMERDPSIRLIAMVKSLD